MASKHLSLTPPRMNRLKFYINVRTSEGVETVDEFPAGSYPVAEIRQLLRDYSVSGGGNYTFYRSSRCTNEWKKKD